jgi:hypothetical protein
MERDRRGGVPRAPCDPGQQFRERETHRMTKTKKPAAKRAKKAVAPVVSPINVGSLVAFKGAKSPVMTVTMLSAEYVGPVEHKTAHVSWEEAGVVNTGVVRLDELEFICSSAEQRASIREYSEAEEENAARERHALALKVAADAQALIAAQAAAQEQKGAV